MIGKSEAPPGQILRAGGAGPYLLVCEHAGNLVPESLGNLGLSKDDVTRHIAWDIGIREVAKKLSVLLDATLILQPYSRLVIDCNRHPGDPDIIAEVSDGTVIPGNQNLSTDDIEHRLSHIHAPFHKKIDGELERRKNSKRPCILITLHSFTPFLTGDSPRPWHIGVIYNRERRLADSLLRLLGECEDIHVGDNEPFAMSDDNVYTIPYHAEGRGIAAVEIELRQDLITDEQGQAHWADLLSEILGKAATELIEGAL